MALFQVDKECKHSRRYITADKEFPIQSVYVHRSLADRSDLLRVTVEEVEEPEDGT